MKTKILAAVTASLMLLGMAVTTTTPVADAAWGDEGAGQYRCVRQWNGTLSCGWH